MAFFWLNSWLCWIQKFKDHTITSPARCEPWSQPRSRGVAWPRPRASGRGCRCLPWKAQLGRLRGWVVQMYHGLYLYTYILNWSYVYIYIYTYMYIYIYIYIYVYIYIYICICVYVYIYMPDILVINRMLSLYYNYWYHNPYQEYHGNFSMDSEWNRGNHGSLAIRRHQTWLAGKSPSVHDG